MEEPDEFEALAKKLINRSGRSQAATAKMLGYHRSTLSKWLKGPNQISFEVLTQFCNMVEATEGERSLLFKLAGYDVSHVVKTTSTALREKAAESGKLETISNLPFSLEEVESYIQDVREPAYLRLNLLRAFIRDGHNSQKLFEALCKDPTREVRLEMGRYIFKNPNPENEIIIDKAVLEELINDTDYDVAANGIKAARSMVQNGTLPVEFLAVARNHPYWLVRKIAIQYVAKVDTPDMLDILYEFRSTSYHVSQQAIRDFVQRHFDQGEFTVTQKNLAVDLIQWLMQAPKVSDISKRKNQKLLNHLSDGSA